MLLQVYKKEKIHSFDLFYFTPVGTKKHLGGWEFMKNVLQLKSFEMPRNT